MGVPNDQSEKKTLKVRYIMNTYFSAMVLCQIHSSCIDIMRYVVQKRKVQGVEVMVTQTLGCIDTVPLITTNSSCNHNTGPRNLIFLKITFKWELHIK